MMTKNANQPDIERPRSGARPVKVLLYPEHNYCRIEDPRMNTVIESRLDEVTRLNDALVFYQLMLVPLTGTVGVTGASGPKGEL